MAADIALWTPGKTTSSMLRSQSSAKPLHRSIEAASRTRVPAPLLVAADGDHDDDRDEDDDAGDRKGRAQA